MAGTGDSFLLLADQAPKLGIQEGKHRSHVAGGLPLVAPRKVCLEDLERLQRVPDGCGLAALIAKLSDVATVDTFALDGQVTTSHRQRLDDSPAVGRRGSVLFEEGFHL